MEDSWDYPYACVAGDREIKRESRIRRSTSSARDRAPSFRIILRNTPANCIFNGVQIIASNCEVFNSLGSPRIVLLGYSDTCLFACQDRSTCLGDRGYYFVDHIYRTIDNRTLLDLNYNDKLLLATFCSSSRCSVNKANSGWVVITLTNFYRLCFFFSRSQMCGNKYCLSIHNPFFYMVLR
ncbi:hypothetical protein PUN28_015915 [Cardiocondyla obscurior]|uniref:Uncharacterized protein n=1 Tax=Cardiocondyla obscurior TaxID=286306 RepID=A0AAW2ESQ6_9HYME